MSRKAQDKWANGDGNFLHTSFVCVFAFMSACISMCSRECRYGCVHPCLRLCPSIPRFYVLVRSIAGSFTIFTYYYQQAQKLHELATTATSECFQVTLFVHANRWPAIGWRWLKCHQYHDPLPFLQREAGELGRKNVSDFEQISISNTVWSEAHLQDDPLDNFDLTVQIKHCLSNHQPNNLQQVDWTIRTPMLTVLCCCAACSVAGHSFTAGGFRRNLELVIRVGR